MKEHIAGIFGGKI